jgi:hypothetical protein
MLTILGGVASYDVIKGIKGREKRGERRIQANFVLWVKVIFCGEVEAITRLACLWC